MKNNLYFQQWSLQVIPNNTIGPFLNKLINIYQNNVQNINLTENIIYSENIPGIVGKGLS